MVDITIKVKVNKRTMKNYERVVNDMVIDTIADSVDNDINVDALLHGGKDIANIVPNYKQLMEREQKQVIKFLTTTLKEISEEHINDIFDYDSIWDEIENSSVLPQFVNAVKASKEFKKRVAKAAADVESIKLAKIEKQAQALGYDLVKA